MKKKMNKILGMILVVLTVALSIFNTTIVNAAPASLSLGHAGRVYPYVDGLSFDTKVLTDGTLIYCMDFHKATPRNTTMTLVGELDAGMAYIIANGYRNKSITGDLEKDYYITQTAIWWYQDVTTGRNNISQSFKNGNADVAGLIGHIKALVDGGVQALAQGYPTVSMDAHISTNEMTLSADATYFLSEPIALSGTSLDSTYKVSLVSNVAGATIVDNNLQPKTEFGINEVFRVMIDNSKVTSYTKNTISVKIDASGTVYKAYEYESSNANLQRVADSAVFGEKTDVSTTISLNYEKEPGTIYVIKKDQETDLGLAGATLVLKDSTGKEVLRWETGTGAQKFTNMPYGKYTVEEIAAPPGYEKSDEIITINLTETTPNQVINYYNEKAEVPTEKGEFFVIKKDKDTDETLPGATLVVRDATGKELVRFVTTDKAYPLYNAPYGTYTIEELQAPEGYEKSDEIHTITIDGTNPSQVVTFYNYKITKPTVEIVKRDSVSQEFISGATMVLKDSAGNIVESWITTGEPKIFTELAPGTYTVSETHAPAGYLLSEETITFEVTTDIVHQVIDFYNTKATNVPVPDTASAGTILFTILGLAIIAAGIGFTVYNAKKAA